MCMDQPKQCFLSEQISVSCVTPSPMNILIAQSTIVIMIPGMHCTHQRPNQRKISILTFHHHRRGRWKFGRHGCRTGRSDDRFGRRRRRRPQRADGGSRTGRRSPSVGRPCGCQVSAHDGAALDARAASVSTITTTGFANGISNADSTARQSRPYDERVCNPKTNRWRVGGERRPSDNQHTFPSLSPQSTTTATTAVPAGLCAGCYDRDDASGRGGTSRHDGRRSR